MCPDLLALLPDQSANVPPTSHDDGAEEGIPNDDEWSTILRCHQLVALLGEILSHSAYTHLILRIYCLSRIDLVDRHDITELNLSIWKVGD